MISNICFTSLFHSARKMQSTHRIEARPPPSEESQRRKDFVLYHKRAKLPVPLPGPGLLAQQTQQEPQTFSQSAHEFQMYASHIQQIEQRVTNR